MVTTVAPGARCNCASMLATDATTASAATIEIERCSLMLAPLLSWLTDRRPPMDTTAELVDRILKPRTVFLATSTLHAVLTRKNTHRGHDHAHTSIRDRDHRSACAAH